MSINSLCFDGELMTIIQQFSRNENIICFPIRNGVIQKGLLCCKLIVWQNLMSSKLSLETQSRVCFRQLKLSNKLQIKFCALSFHQMIFATG